jgi:hypothetical protein
VRSASIASDNTRSVNFDSDCTGSFNIDSDSTGSVTIAIDRDRGAVEHSGAQSSGVCIRRAGLKGGKRPCKDVGEATGLRLAHSSVGVVSLNLP